MAAIAAIGVIASTAAAVIGLLPKGGDDPNPKVSLSGLKTHLEPLRTYEARGKLVASGDGAVLVASAEPSGDLLAQDTTGPDGGTPPPTTPTTPLPPNDGSGGGGTGTGPGTSTETVPTPPPEGPTKTVPAPDDASEKRPVCEQTASLSAPIEGLTTAGGTNHLLPPCRIVLTIPPEDFEKSVTQLKQESDDLQTLILKQYALSADCAQLASPTCPTNSGTNPRARGGTAASRAVKAEAKKLALIREQLRQLRNTRTDRGPDGKRDLLGVRLDYVMRVCGFEDQSLRVFWTLFDSSRPPRVPYYWHSNRLANTLERDSAGCEEVSPSFWVPLPPRKARFTVALAVYDEDGNRRGPLVESGPFDF